MTLGNRQLLSIFFLVIILLAVFFTMGYLMGRGTGTIGPTLAKNSAPDAPSGGRPEGAGSEVAGNPPVTQTGEQHPPELAPGQAVVSTTPAIAPAAPAQEAGAKPAEKKPAEPPAPAPQDTGGSPQPGRTYLQVAATTAPEAELMVDVLKKRGFPALLAPVPNGRPAVAVLEHEGQPVTGLDRAHFRQVGFEGDRVATSDQFLEIVIDDHASDRVGTPLAALEGNRQPSLRIAGSGIGVESRVSNRGQAALLPLRQAAVEIAGVGRSRSDQAARGVG